MARSGEGSDPMFAGPIENVTVNVGREAVMECHVNNLKQYKVSSLFFLESPQILIVHETKFLTLTFTCRFKNNM